MFLSWLIESTSEWNVAAVTGVIFAVGMLLFMIPPVPGLLVYLAAGIILVKNGRASMGLVGSIVYTCFVCLILKLTACAVQQKIIGENLGGSIAVKQMVGINTKAIRAMRVMLSDPGMTSRKVAVLVGGPDWPVSVLCGTTAILLWIDTPDPISTHYFSKSTFHILSTGILGLPLYPILLGTIPIIGIIIPAVLSGTFIYMGSIEGDDGFDAYPWAGTYFCKMSVAEQRMIF